MTLTDSGPSAPSGTATPADPPASPDRGRAGTPALYECVITHVRRSPWRHAFAYRSYLWLVDLDAVPARGPLARFLPRDHAGDPAGTLRGNLEAFLAESGIDLDGGRITMLAHARVLGHVFNPLTVYWCRYRDGRPACVVAEVHNTYGGRHRYLVRPDERGRAETGKEFYVSPFHPVDGRYRMSLPEPGERLALTVTLHREGARPFTAAVRGARRPATWAGVLRAFARHPYAPLLGALRIRVQGVRLYLRGLPVVPRAVSPKGNP